MALHYNIVFALLASEMIFMIALLLPLPLAMRRPLTNWLARSEMAEKFKYYLRIVCFFVVILFVDALTRSMRIASDLNEAERSPHLRPIVGDARADAASHSRMFYSQRNTYLCGFTLFLTLAIYRLQTVFSKWMEAEEKLDTIRQQTAKQSGEHHRLAQKAETTKAEIDDLKDQIVQLQAIEKKYKQLDRQIENQNASYIELSDRYAALERKHEMRSGDNRKDD